MAPTTVSTALMKVLHAHHSRQPVTIIIIIIITVVVVVVIRPHRSTTYVDAACCHSYSAVGLSICLSRP